MGLKLQERHLLARVRPALAALLAVPEKEVGVEAGGEGEADVVVSAAGHTFAVEVKGSSSPGLVAAQAEQAARAARAFRKRVIPLVAVPYMGQAGKQACERAGVSWFDFSGNAHIVGPGLRIIVEGQPNRFRSRGRPASVFAPKSSRVARWLLMHPEEARTQRELAQVAEVSEGLVSRIVSRLEAEHFVVRDDSGLLRLANPQLLLEAWRDEYRFSKHTILQGHVAARSGDALTHFVGDALAAASVEHAATGLSAAWQLTRFASFRIATFFVKAAPDEELGQKLGFREDARGANLWLVVPNDSGVFHGAAEREGVRCVHPVQAYFDLAEHPERAADAAARVHAEYLSW